MANIFRRRKSPLNAMTRSIKSLEESVRLLKRLGPEILVDFSGYMADQYATQLVGIACSMRALAALQQERTAAAIPAREKGASNDSHNAVPH
jgi:hypothetical protein